MTQENALKYISETIADIKIIIDKIDERQQKHLNGLISVEKDVEFITKEINELKKTHKDEVEIVWDEIRRRDKNIKWFIGVMVAIIMPILTFSVSFFTRK